MRERGLGEIEQTIDLLDWTLTRNELVSGKGRDAVERVNRGAKRVFLDGEYKDGIVIF